MKYRKPGSSKRQNVQNESVALTNGGSSAKQFKWQLPEPKLHVMQMPNNQNLTSEQAKLDSANPSNSNTRVSARTVVSLFQLKQFFEESSRDGYEKKN